MEEYKSNSHASKEKAEKKQIEQIVTTPVKTKKRTEIRRIIDILVADDVGDIKSYVFFDVLIPAIKKAIWDIFTGGLEMTLFGGRKETKSSTASRISYAKYYDNDRNSDISRQKPRFGYNFEEVIIEDRGEAEETLARMDELINMYGIASVADFYDLVGINGNYTDNKYGWTDLSNASVMRARGGGYIIKFPKALPIS